MALEVFIDLISKGGVIVVLAMFVWGLRQRWWVMGQEYEEMKAERDYERNRANISTDLADDGAKEAGRRAIPATRARRAPNA